MSELSRSWSDKGLRLPSIMKENVPSSGIFVSRRGSTRLPELQYDENIDAYEEELDFRAQERNKKRRNKKFIRKRTKVLGSKLTVMERRRNMIRKMHGHDSKRGTMVITGANVADGTEDDDHWRPVQISPRLMVYRKRFGQQRPLTPSPVPMDRDNTLNIDVISEESDGEGSVNGTVAPSEMSVRSTTHTVLSLKSASVPPTTRGGLGASFNGFRRSNGTAATAKSRFAASFNIRPDFDALAKFVKMTRLIIVLNNWISVLRETEAGDDGEEGGKKKSGFNDLVLETSINGLANSGLTFDPLDYKAKKEINLSDEVKEILTTASASRTPAMIKQATLGLQHLRSFAEYPLHMQEKLAQVAYYQSVPTKRVIIRQGHTAENFYFILSGHASVKVLERNSKSGEPQMRTINVLKRGYSFGELALLHHSKRAATVVSQDSMQLLAIGRADFFKIFMSGTNPGDIPDHIKFISNLDFMKDWPLDNLLEHPEMCLIHFYKRNVVITQDSTDSDWIYVIKSGTCQVMKQLKKVKPNTKQWTKTMVDETLRLPKLGTGEQSPRVDTRKKRPTRAMVMTPGIPQRSKTQLSEQFGVKGSIIDQLSNLHHEAILDSLQILQVDKGRPPIGESKTNFRERRPELKSYPKSSSKKEAAGFSKSRFGAFPAIGAEFVVQQPKSGSNSERGSAQIERSNTQVSVSFSKDTADPDSNNNAPGKPGGGLAKLVANKWLAKAKGLPVPDEDDIKKKDELRRGESVFVQVELLKPRDVFGLTAMRFDDSLDIQTTKVSLVSRGAECIMLNKKFFIQHSTDRVKENIKNLVRRYPSEKKLQENLQLSEDWVFYKRKLLSDVTERLRTNAGLS